MNRLKEGPESWGSLAYVVYGGGVVRIHAVK